MNRWTVCRLKEQFKLKQTDMSNEWGDARTVPCWSSC